MPLFVKIAARELRSGMKGFYIALACLILSSFTLTASQSFTAAIGAQLQQEGRTILGGDVELRRAHTPFSAKEKEFFAAHAQQTSLISTMRVMATTAQHNAVAQLKAVDAAYPLVGAVKVQGGKEFTAAAATAAATAVLLAPRVVAGKTIYGAVAAPTLLSALGIKVGEIFMMGAASFQLRALIEKEPDGLADGFAFAPKILISNRALQATTLVQFGTLITYRARLLLPPRKGAVAAAGGAAGSASLFQASLERSLPNAGFEVRNLKDASPSLRRFVERVSMFLTLAALTTFLVSGIGIANAVSVWFAQRRRTIATLKCLGASARTIFSAYLTQILVMTLLALIFGASLGAVAPFVLLPFVADFLPLAVSAIFSPLAIFIAVLYGLVVTILFSLLPLAIARATPPSHLFRSFVAPLGLGFVRSLSFSWWLILAGLAGGLVFIALSLATERTFAIYFLSGAGLSLLLLYGVGILLVSLLRRLSANGGRRGGGGGGGVIRRIALGNITRPASQSKSTIMALGLGLALLCAIALVEGNLNYQIARGLPARAPSFFLADITQDQYVEMKTFLESSPAVSQIKMVPLLRAPLMKINNQPLSVYSKKASEDVAWVLRGDRGLTYAAALPPDAELVEGTWWAADYQGAPLLSVSENVASGLGLKIGDTITINLFGVPVQTTIHNFRKVDWAQGGMNFVFIFSPAPFNEIPLNYFATFHVRADKIQDVRHAVVKKFPKVVLIETGEALNVIASLMEQIAFAARAASFWTLLAGILVLAAAQAASFQQKLTESVIFKVLGAHRALIAKVGIAEYLLLGTAAAAAALIIGLVAAWAVITFLWRADFVFLPFIVLFTLLAALVIALLCGVGVQHRILAQKPAPFLRAYSGI